MLKVIFSERVMFHPNALNVFMAMSSHSRSLNSFSTNVMMHSRNANSVVMVTTCITKTKKRKIGLGMKKKPNKQAGTIHECTVEIQ